MEINKLNEERKRQGMSIAELAEKANLPKGTIEKILFGIVKNPRVDTMQAIERALGIAPEWTEEEREAGIVDTTKVVLNANEMELIDLYREIGRVHGEKMQQLLLAFANLLLGDHE